MKRLCWCAAALCAIVLCGCNKKTDHRSEFEKANFSSIGDKGRVAYIMERAEPDSVARFIIDAALGHIEGAHIDSVAAAVDYAYTNLRTEDMQVKFFEEFDAYSESLPLDDKMKIYVASGKSDAQQLGYQLGLEYVNTIREQRKSASDIKAELEAFKRACADDTATLERFIKGFRLALEHDRGQDLPAEVYSTFINWE